MKELLSRFDCLLGRLTKAAAILAGLFLLAAAFIIFYEIIMRDVFQAPTEWVLEVSTYLIIMAGFLGLAVTFRAHAHVNVDFLSARLSQAAQRHLDMAVNFFSILLFLIFMTESMDMVTASYSYHKLSPSILRFPLFIPQLSLVLGAALLLLELVNRFLRELFQMDTPATARKEH
jgi:TRAP-type C4-dicarboxylate transport system permease small subunit